MSWTRQDIQSYIFEALPPAYNFEIEKTLCRLDQSRSKCVCLQFPEGLMIWAESIAHIIETFAKTVEHVFVLTDVTYGACCIDDVRARHLCCDFLVHYGHSCLIPIDAVDLNCLYVFVDIKLDPTELAANIARLIPLALTQGDNRDERSPVALMGTLQFLPSVHEAARILQNSYEIHIPQCSPLTPGETLGCTSPILAENTEVCVFVADGRFHVEAAMMQNPKVKFYRYDPFTKRMFAESYDYPLCLNYRNKAIQEAKNMNIYVIILSTLGRQGSVGIAEYLKENIQKRKPSATTITILLSELNPSTLSEILGERRDVCFVNVGCPRLAIDWGNQFSVAPVLTSFELIASLDGRCISSHPMDYFAADGGVWTNYGRGGSRNGSIHKSVNKLEIIKERWRQKKIALQNISGT